jgi:hypothetical protein
MLFLAPAELRSLDARGLEELLAHTGLTVAFAGGQVSGVASAALLFADYAVIAPGTGLTIDTPEGWAAVVWRLGRTALRWQLDGGRPEDVVDEVTDREPERWFEEWMSHRSVMALDAAAALIRSRGGDRLERAEFARMFAAGEPQKGLGAFLAKVRPSYS